MNLAGRQHSYLASLLLFSSMGLLSACGGGNSSSSPQNTITSVSVTPATATVMEEPRSNIPLPLAEQVVTITV